MNSILPLHLNHGRVAANCTAVAPSVSGDTRTSPLARQDHTSLVESPCHVFIRLRI